MKLSRQEHWGSIHYDTAADKFSAEVRENCTPIPGAPIGVGWIVIGACNKKCIQCYGNAEQLPRAILSTRACFKLVDRLAEAKVMRVTLSGGEPLLRDDLFEIINRLCAADISVIVGTNGTYLNTSNIDGLRSCTRVEISLDAATKELNNSIRPSRIINEDSWQETMNAIALCLNRNIPLRVLTNINALNQIQIFEMASRLHSIGVGEWGVSWTMAAGRAFSIYDQLRPQSELIEHEISRARDAYPTLQIGYSNRSDFTKYYCLILPDGQIATEDTRTGQKIKYGSLLTKSIAEVWNEAYFNVPQHFEKWIGDRVLRPEAKKMNLSEVPIQPQAPERFEADSEIIDR